MLVVMKYCAVLLMAAVYSTAGTHGADKKTNILFMMVDDCGWANVGYHRATPTRDISTPNMDELVQQGLQLDHHYVYNWCSPSRSAFLSGRVPIHVNDGSCERCYNPDDPVSGYGGIPRNMTLFVTKLKNFKRMEITTPSLYLL